MSTGFWMIFFLGLLIGIFVGFVIASLFIGRGHKSVI